MCLLPVDRRVAIGALGDHPCFADEDDDTLAGKLLREMLAAGVSRWHPDPMKALADAKQKRRTAIGFSSAEAERNVS